MNPIARLSGLSLLLYPATMAAADQLQLRVTPPEGDDVSARAELLTTLAAVEAHQRLFEAASWLFLAAAVLSIPMTLVLWRLAVAGSRRWAWAAAGLGTLAVVGQFVQAYSHFGMLQVFSGLEDRQAAAVGLQAIDSNVYSTVLFLPYLIGVALAVPVAAIGLKRAAVIPWWALASVLVGSALFLVLGSTSAVTVVWAVCLVAGLAPAALTWLRGETAARPSSLAALAAVPVG